MAYGEQRFIRYVVLASIIGALGFTGVAYLVEGARAFQRAPLLQGHASLDAQCEKCHDPWGSVSNAKCSVCHRDLFQREPDHGREKPLCAQCHLDHRGRRFDIKKAAKKLKTL